MAENTKESIGWAGLFCFLFPIVGIILGFVWIRRPYGKTAFLLAGLGFLTGIILGAVVRMSGH